MARFTLPDHLSEILSRDELEQCRRKMAAIRAEDRPDEHDVSRTKVYCGHYLTGTLCLQYAKCNERLGYYYSFCANSNICRRDGGIRYIPHQSPLTAAQYKEYRLFVRDLLHLREPLEDPEEVDALAPAVHDLPPADLPPMPVLPLQNGVQNEVPTGPLSLLSCIYLQGSGESMDFALDSGANGRFRLIDHWEMLNRSGLEIKLSSRIRVHRCIDMTDANPPELEDGIIDLTVNDFGHRNGCWVTCRLDEVDFDASGTTVLNWGPDVAGNHWPRLCQHPNAVVEVIDLTDD